MIKLLAIPLFFLAACATSKPAIAPGPTKEFLLTQQLDQERLQTYLLKGELQASQAKQDALATRISRYLAIHCLCQHKAVLGAPDAP